MPPPVRYLEDFTPGFTMEAGSRTVTAEEIVAFAREYDPQPFHLDPEAGKKTFFGGLVASGWHTAGMMMRIMVDEILSPESSLGSPGVDELRWLKPVRPGDTLRVRFSVLEQSRSRSKPDRGTIRMRTEVLNQHGEVVMTVLAMGMIRAREATPA